MNDRKHDESDATVKLPTVPAEADDFDPERTIVVEDWSHVSMPVVPPYSAR